MFYGTTKCHNCGNLFKTSGKGTYLGGLYGHEKKRP